MAFKSIAQKEKLAQMVKDGSLPQSVYDTWLAETGDKKLPERLEPKPKAGKPKFKITNVKEIK